MAAAMTRGGEETHDGSDSQHIPEEIVLAKIVIGTVAAHEMIGMKHEVPCFFGPFEIGKYLEQLRPKACVHRHGNPPSDEGPRGHNTIARSSVIAVTPDSFIEQNIAPDPVIPLHRVMRCG
jgi:hypothetical protein